MGIPNFSSFVSKAGLRKPKELFDTFVVIDGHNLVYCLYTEYSNQIPNDFLFGGNYVGFRLFLKTFFENLNKCQITSIWVFDGGLNIQLKDNRKTRFENNFKNSQELSDKFGGNTDNEELTTDEHEITIPHLLSNVMMSVIKESPKAICFQTNFDADQSIAKLANDLKCPVISNDSDFLIMTIDEGVISCDSFKWQKPFKPFESKQSNVYHIDCKVYRISEFVDKFKLKPEMLPIFGSLMGNDVIDDKIFDELFDHIKNEMRSLSFAFEVDINESTNNRWLKMSRLLHWLSTRFSGANQAIGDIENYLKYNQINAKDFKMSIESYSTADKCYLKELMDHKLAKTEDKDIPIDRIVGDKRFPKWFLLDYFYKSELASNLFTYIDSKVLLQSPLIEDFKLYSCFQSSLKLNGFLLGLLRLKRSDRTPMQMTTRKGYKIIEILIQPKTRISNTTGVGRELPILPELRELSPNESKQLLFDILGFKEEWMTRLEEKLVRLTIDKQDIEFWNYFLLVIKYWKKNTKEFSIRFIQFIRAIIMSIIYYRYPSLSKEEFIGMTAPIERNFKIFITHYYCEFESIYSKIHSINALLGYPIPDVKLHDYMNGVLYYNLFKEIVNDSNPLKLSPFKEDRLNTINNLILESVCAD